MSGLTIAAVIAGLIVTAIIAAVGYELIDIFALSLRVRSINRGVLTSAVVIVSGLILYLGTRNPNLLAVACLFILIGLLGHFIEWLREKRKVEQLVRLSQLRNEAYQANRLDEVKRYQNEIKSIQNTMSWNLQELEDKQIIQ